ncbi:lytic transglycosylase domain-containing protein [Kineobactrum sediminis]|uniref:lytic transglycosylase domain-containing protein n=1 Tax=Kineobactrum sediminis TaxID=1905677 RepID=UPI00138FB3C4|nr:lytic transglycosylase domain-containing protein [Kineobactrum sediminis]
MKTRLTALAPLLLTVAGSTLAAAPLEDLLKPGGLEAAIPPGYRQVAAERSIPPSLFYAIALTESGYRTPATKGLRPWPWTLNIRGEGHYYPSQRAAATALSATLSAGETGVDVGLMQIHWHYHHAALGNIRTALDPYHNLRVGAGILAECYRQRADWWSATGCYHAPNNDTLAQRYQARVQRHWRTLQQDP